MKISLSDHFGYRKLIRFTLPTIAMMIFTSIYGVVDGLFVSNVVGSDAFAAVNLIMPVPMILGSLGVMFGTGGSALVSMTLGEGDKRKASEYFSMLLVLMAVIGVIFSIIGTPLLAPLAKILGATDVMLPYCVTYARILLFAIPVFIIQYALQSFMVVAEKPQMGLIVSVLSGVTNMVLDFLLVYVLQMGVAGAAYATIISQIVGVVIPLIYFLRDNDSPIRLVKPRFDARAILKSASNGSSEMVSNISASLISMLYNWQLMRIAGPDGVVAYGVIMYAGFIFSGTYFGYSVGSAPVFGYHYGAGNYKELKNLLKRSLILLGIAAVILTALSILTAGLQARIFVSYDEELMLFTRNAIMLYSLSYFISEMNIFTSSFFTAMNNGGVSALLSFLRTFVFLVLAILIAPQFLGVNGIWLAVVFAEAMALVVSVAFLVKYKDQYLTERLHHNSI